MVRIGTWHRRAGQNVFRLTRRVRIGALEDLLRTPMASAALSPELGAFIARSRQATRTQWEIPRHLHPLCAQAAISVNEHGRPHNHPFHAALRARFEGLVHGVVSGKDFTLLSAKPLPGNPLVAAATAMCNSILVGKDLTRFTNGIFAAPIVTTSLAVMLDVLQMLNPADVASLFERSPNLHHLFATSVISVEGHSNLPDQFPDVYKTIPVRGGRLYVPEGHLAGQYFEPASASDWLTCSRIDLADGSFLHVTELESFVSHRLFLISRVHSLPETHRLLQLGDWITIPSFLLPLVSAPHRRCRSTLLKKIISFQDRYPGTSVEDYHAKVAQIEAAMLAKIPYAEGQAAALLAHRLKVSHMRTGFRDLFYFSLFFIPRFIYAPYATLVSVFQHGFAMNMDVEDSLVVEPHPYDAAYATPTSWTSREYLPAVDLYARSGHTYLGAYALLNFCCGSWVVPKVIVTHIVETLFKDLSFSALWARLQFYVFALEVSPARVAISTFILWLTYLGFFSVSFSAPSVVRHALRSIYHRSLSLLGLQAYADYSLLHFVSAVYGVGDQHLFARPGYGYLYQGFLSWYAFSTLFPRYVDSFWWRPGNVLHTIYQGFTSTYHFGLFVWLPRGLLVLSILGSLHYTFLPVLFVRWFNFAPQGWSFIFFPFYFCRSLFALLFGSLVWVAHFFTPAARATPLLLPLSTPFNTPLDGYGTFVPPPAPNFQAPPPNAPAVPGIFVPNYPQPIVPQPHAGISRQQIYTQAGPLPGALTHPYRSWFFNTDNTTFQNMVNGLFALPPSVNALDPNFSCFWQALSTVVGIDAGKLACVFFASQPGGDLLPHNHIGLVTPSQMTLACRFFNVGLTTRFANNAQPLPADLFVQVAASPNFPTLNLEVTTIPTTLLDAQGVPITVFHVINFLAPPGPNTLPVAPGPFPPPGYNPPPHPTMVGYTAPTLSAALFAPLLAAFPAAYALGYAALNNVGAPTPFSTHYFTTMGLPPPRLSTLTPRCPLLPWSLPKIIIPTVAPLP
jgi:hypothetical protein